MIERRLLRFKTGLDYRRRIWSDMRWYSCFTAIVLAVYAATTAPAAAQQNLDHAFGLIGTWKCESAARSLGTVTFTRDGSGSISMKNTFRTSAGLYGEFDETYQLDPETGTWNWESKLRSAPNFKEGGTAESWTGSKWIFEGTQRRGQTTEPLRMIYTRVSDTSFTREFEAKVNGTWLTQSASSCTRGTSVAERTNVSELRKKMAAASQNVKSFRLQLSSPMGMTSAATVTMQPMMMHMQLASGPIVMELYLANGYLYQRIGDGNWQKQPVPSTASLPVDSLKALARGTSMTVGPDVNEGGVTYGSYEVSVSTASVPGAPAAEPISLSCTYDKHTFLTHQCKNSVLTETFLDYNGPNNLVTLPPELSTATEAPVTTIPVPSPQPTQ